jgi:hypothetical protein
MPLASFSFVFDFVVVFLACDAILPQTNLLLLLLLLLLLIPRCLLLLFHRRRRRKKKFAFVAASKTICCWQSLGRRKRKSWLSWTLKEEMLERRNERLQLAFDKGDVLERRRNSLFSFGVFIRLCLLNAVSESVASFALLLFSSSSPLHLFRLRLRDVEIRGGRRCGCWC